LKALGLPSGRRFKPLHFKRTVLFVRFLFQGGPLALIFAYGWVVFRPGWDGLSGVLRTIVVVVVLVLWIFGWQRYCLVRREIDVIDEAIVLAAHPRLLGEPAAGND